jgi:hypothetical protein
VYGHCRALSTPFERGSYFSAIPTTAQLCDKRHAIVNG